MTRVTGSISGIRSYLPDRQLTNDELARQWPDWDSKKAYEKTGVAVRRVSGDDECASDLGCMAARLLFETGITAPDDIDFLLFCTQTPDHLLPATACIVHDRLGLNPRCGALDFSIGCSGFVYGLALANGLIETHLAEKVLVITAETYTKLIHPSDRSVRSIFGDGAAATLISAVHADSELIWPFVCGTDGKGFDKLMVPAGGMRMPLSAENLADKDCGSGICRSARNLHMNGPEIFSFASRTVPRTVDALLSRSGLSLDDIDYFIFHQASKVLLEHLRKKIGIPHEKFYLDLQHCGNTVSSSIPIALESALKNDTIRDGSRVMLVGFGVGYSWAGTIVRFSIQGDLGHDK